MTDREKFWQMLTVCTNPRSFKYDTDKFQMSVEIPILPENIKDFKAEIMGIFGREIPQIDRNANPMYFGYKFDGRYIDIDGQTIKYDQFGRLSVSEENVISSIEQNVLNKLGIDIKNDEISIENFPGFSDVSQKPFEPNNFSFKPIETGLDYSNRDHWYLYPQRSSGLLDVFILYPTTIYDEDKDLIINITDIEMQKGVRDFLKIIIPIFKDLPVNLYMPKYRQFNGAKIEEWNLRWFSENGKIIRDDIYNAFGYFLSECQSTNQFITFSHEQGSYWNNLLATTFAHDLAPEIIEKWSNVWSLGASLDDTILAHSKFSSSGLPTDKRTIISWNLATESEWSQKHRKNFGDGTSRAVNPITFKRTYKEKIKGSNIALVKYFDNNIIQIKDTIRAIMLEDKWGNEIVMLPGIDENSLLTKQQIDQRDEQNFGYLLNNTIGFFAENIRNNIIARYELVQGCKWPDDDELEKIKDEIKDKIIEKISDYKDLIEYLKKNINNLPEYIRNILVSKFGVLNPVEEIEYEENEKSIKDFLEEHLGNIAQNIGDTLRDKFGIGRK